MAAETISNLIFTGPLTWTPKRPATGRRVVLRARRASAPRPARSARRKPAPSAGAAPCCTDAANGHGSTASTASGVASPKKSAPPPASASTCPSVGSPGTPAATASPVAPRDARETRRDPRRHVMSSARDGHAARASTSNGCEPWFAAHVDGAHGGPLHAALISGGRSNLTYADLRRRARVGAAPSAARPRAADRARHGARVHGARPRSRPPTCRCRARSRSATTSPSTTRRST